MELREESNWNFFSFGLFLLACMVVQEEADLWPLLAGLNVACLIQRN